MTRTTSSAESFDSAMQRTKQQPKQPKPLIPMRTFATARPAAPRPAPRPGQTARASTGSDRVYFRNALRELLGLLEIRRRATRRHLAGDLRDELGRQRHDLLFIESLGLEIAKDRLRENLHRPGLRFTVTHDCAPVLSTVRARLVTSVTWQNCIGDQPELNPLPPNQLCNPSPGAYVAIHTVRPSDCCVCPIVYVVCDSLHRYGFVLHGDSAGRRLRLDRLPPPDRAEVAQGASDRDRPRRARARRRRW